MSDTKDTRLLGPGPCPSGPPGVEGVDGVENLAGEYLLSTSEYAHKLRNKVLDEVIAYFEELDPVHIDAIYSVYNAGRSCCVGAHLAGLLCTGHLSFMKGFDTLCDDIGVRRSHFPAICEKVGLQEHPYSSWPWSIEPAEMFKGIKWYLNNEYYDKTEGKVL